MKHYIILFSALCCTFLLDAQPQWMNTPFLNSQGRLEDIHFINRDTGWVVSGGGQIFRTNDGAMSWEQQYDSPFYIRSVGFVDDQLGFAGTLDAAFLKTEDGGANWIDITEELPIVPSGICGIQWLDDETILAVGAWFEPAFMLRSEDRGVSWESLDMNEYSVALVDVHFVSRDTGFVCGKGESGGNILYTTDGGIEWEEVYSTENSGDYVWKLQFIDDLHVVSSVQTFGLNGWLPYSENGGLTWTAKTVPYGDTQGIGFVTPTKGWIGGYNNGFFATEDAGDSWDLLPFGGNYNRFQVFDSTFAYASGDQVYKYMDTTVVMTNVRPSRQRQFDPQLAVSPNPAKGQAIISFELSSVNNIDLNLYDSKGALLQQVFNGRLLSGKHTFPVDLEAGHGYFLVGLQVNEGLYSVPLIGR